MPRRQILVALALALLTGLGITTPPFDLLRGLSLDVLTGLRWHGFGDTAAPDSSPVVVVAIDEATYRTPPFEGTRAPSMVKLSGRRRTTSSPSLQMLSARMLR